MKPKKIWIAAAVLAILAGAGIAACCTKDNATEDSSRFVAITDVVPDAILYTGDNSKSPAGRSITEEQFEHRMILRRAMLEHGFKSLDSEWWHFTLRDEPFPDTNFTFPVR